MDDYKVATLKRHIKEMEEEAEHYRNNAAALRRRNKYGDLTKAIVWIGHAQGVELVIAQYKDELKKEMDK